MCVNSGNYNVACWSLLLSNLPLLYDSCSDQQLQVLAHFILSSLLLPESATDRKGVGAGGVVTAFVESEGFLEMRQLHHHLFSAYLTTIKWSVCVCVQ